MATNSFNNEFLRDGFDVLCGQGAYADKNIEEVELANYARKYFAEVVFDGLGFNPSNDLGESGCVVLRKVCDMKVNEKYTRVVNEVYEELRSAFLINKERENNGN